jgi:hypothetical protein
MTIATLLTTIGSIVTAFLGYVGDTVNTITGNSVLLFTFLVPFATVGITVVKRLINTRA